MLALTTMHINTIIISSHRCDYFFIVVFTEAGIKPTLPLAIICGSGKSSCSLLLVAYECGNASAAAVYY